MRLKVLVVSVLCPNLLFCQTDSNLVLKALTEAEAFKQSASVPKNTPDGFLLGVAIDQVLDALTKARSAGDVNKISDYENMFTIVEDAYNIGSYMQISGARGTDQWSGLCLDVANLMAFNGYNRRFYCPSAESVFHNKFSCNELANDPMDAQWPDGGNGIEFDEINITQALPACEAAAGMAPIQPHYVYLYGRVLDAAKRYGEAYRQYSRAAENGYAAAMTDIGEMYMDAKGVPKSVSDGLSWTRRGAEAGNPAAMINLGTAYQEGIGVPKSGANAVAWYSKVVDRWPSNVLALNKLGQVYRDGEVVPRDYNLAFEWFRKSALYGDPWGQINLGIQYQNGWGVEKNTDMARSLYSRAAKSKDLVAAKTATELGSHIQPSQVITGVAVAAGIIALIAILSSSNSSHDQPPSDSPKKSNAYDDILEKQREDDARRARERASCAAGAFGASDSVAAYTSCLGGIR